MMFGTRIQKTCKTTFSHMLGFFFASETGPPG